MSVRFKLLAFSLFLLFSPFLSFGQKIFSDFHAYQQAQKIEVHWHFHQDTAKLVKRINIQRTGDTSTYFSTIGSVQKPRKNPNQFLDKKPLADSNFYRLFILFDNGSYAFSKATKAVPIPDSILEKRLAERPFRAQEKPDKFNYNKALLEDYFQPSIYIYTNKKGNVNLRLPKVKKHHYLIRFYDDSDRFLFELNKINQPSLIIDKANFLHSGWFHYKIYKDAHIFEKWKFYVPDK